MGEYADCERGRLMLNKIRRAAEVTIITGGYAILLWSAIAIWFDWSAQ